MPLESIIEWIQTNLVQTELMAIQLSGIAMLGYGLYKGFKERKDRKYLPNGESLEQPYKSRNLPEHY